MTLTPESLVSLLSSVPVRLHRPAVALSRLTLSDAGVVLSLALIGTADDVVHAVTGPVPTSSEDARWRIALGSK